MKILLSSPSKLKSLLFLTKRFSKPQNVLILISKRSIHENSIGASFIRQKSHNRALSKKLLLSPTEATKILRTNEETVDVDSSCPIKYYDINYLGSNSPPEDRQAQAKLALHDVYMFGVFDGHGGHYCADSVNMRLFDYIGLNLLTSPQLEDLLNTKASEYSAAYKLWSTYQSPYPDLRSLKLKEIHKASLRSYAEDLLKDRIMEESIGNEIKFDIEKALVESFTKLDIDILNEAIPKNAIYPDKETMDVAMSGR